RDFPDNAVLRGLAVTLLPSLAALGPVVAWAKRNSPVRVARVACPQSVDAAASTSTPVVDVLRAAQQRLAKQTFAGALGKTYHLTPTIAPIDFIERVAILGNGAPLDQMIPGQIALHRLAASECGTRTANASWAIHDTIGVSVVAGLGDYSFFVKTVHGWRFWGSWCAATKSSHWRSTYCP